MKRMLVVGARRSGTYAALLGVKNGFEVFVTEKSDSPEIREYVELLKENGIEYEIGGHLHWKNGNYDFAVVSPGVPRNAEIISEINAKKIPLIGEMEFAFRMSPDTKVVSITGTNGKSTTTALTGNIFSHSGLNSVFGGNLGTPYSELLYHNPHPDVAVLETSCFQLETIVRFHPFISVFLNFSEDHLNRYENMEEYLHYKMRIFENQTDSDFAVLNFSDKTLREKSKNLKAKVFYFSPDKKPERGAYAENGKIYFVDNGVKEPVIPVSEIKLRGKHNVENVLAAILSAKLFGLTNDVIREGVGTFKGLEHRLEEVRMLNGVLYVNDSKATTPDSVIKALNSFNEKIVLIAGGSSKNNDFTEMAKLFSEKLRKLILIGETAPDIANSALESGFSDIVFATDLKEAVLLSKKIAKSGDVVLLSPACASFDMFADFEDRGRQFKEIVKDL